VSAYDLSLGFFALHPNLFAFLDYRVYGLRIGATSDRNPDSQHKDQHCSVLDTKKNTDSGDSHREIAYIRISISGNNDRGYLAPIGQVPKHPNDYINNHREHIGKADRLRKSPRAWLLQLRYNIADSKLVHSRKQCQPITRGQPPIEPKLYSFNIGKLISINTGQITVVYNDDNSHISNDHSTNQREISQCSDFFFQAKHELTGEDQ
jgi:hypothetical protein